MISGLGAVIRLGHHENPFIRAHTRSPGTFSRLFVVVVVIDDVVVVSAVVIVGAVTLFFSESSFEFNLAVEKSSSSFPLDVSFSVDSMMICRTVAPTSSPPSNWSHNFNHERKKESEREKCSEMSSVMPLVGKRREGTAKNFAFPTAKLAKRTSRERKLFINRCINNCIGINKL